MDDRCYCSYLGYSGRLLDVLVDFLSLLIIIITIIILRKNSVILKNPPDQFDILTIRSKTCNTNTYSEVSKGSEKITEKSQ